MAVGSTYRRCSCRGANGKPLGSACPKLKQSKHGQWGWRLELPPDAEETVVRDAGAASSPKPRRRLNLITLVLCLLWPKTATRAPWPRSVI